MKGIILFLNRYFEKISLVYHVSFILFLSYLIFFRKPNQKIPELLIKGLGLYVMAYGAIIFFLGDEIINRDAMVEAFKNIIHSMKRSL